MKKYVIKSLLLLMMLFMIVSCREPIEKSLTLNKYTVTFDSMGGSLVTSAEVIENLLATEPTAPTKTNYTFGGWYTDNTTFTNKWNFATDTVAGNMTLYAKWKASEILVEFGTAGTVTTTKSFYIHQFEVTQSQFQDLMGYNPSAFIGVNHPVEKVTWYDAIAYANKLSEKEGFDKFYNISDIVQTGDNITSATVTENLGTNGYRLPTEVEWLYAAQGGTSSQNYTYAGSNTYNDVAWTSANNTPHGTKEIGTKSANELGIYDMSGNVWEWTNLWSGTSVVFRGGSWDYNSFVASFAGSQGSCSNLGYFRNDIGFRLVRDY